jgi:hypothetical protein
MTDKFKDPKTGKELFRINDSNQEELSEDFKAFKKLKDKQDGTSDNFDRGSGDSEKESGEGSCLHCLCGRET